LRQRCVASLGAADPGTVARRIRLEPVPSLDSIAAEWSALALAGGNVFSTPEWASTWWRHHGARFAPLVFACRDDEATLAAIVPLYVWTARRVRIARFIGTGPADQLGPVSAPGDRAVAAEALRAIGHSAEIDVLLAELLPADKAWRTSFGTDPLRVEASPTISLARDWESYLAARSANLRQQIRRRERRLRRDHSLQFRLAGDAARLQSDLDVLFSLHRARWGTDRSAFLPWERFHRDFAAVALERGWLRLWFLDLDGRAVAAWYGFRFAGTESYYQAGRDPSQADESVGFVLLAHTIREAASDGMREYRLLRGSESFKQRFADLDSGLETFAIAHGVRGRLARVTAAAALRSNLVRSLLRPPRLG
jgi:CelD/BcsL family acetyltransferase involved in cellulose biosynthesis